MSLRGIVSTLVGLAAFSLAIINSAQTPSTDAITVDDAFRLLQKLKSEKLINSAIPEAYERKNLAKVDSRWSTEVAFGNSVVRVCFDAASKKPVSYLEDKEFRPSTASMSHKDLIRFCEKTYRAFGYKDRLDFAPFMKPVQRDKYVGEASISATTRVNGIRRLSQVQFRVNASSKELLSFNSPTPAQAPDGPVPKFEGEAPVLAACKEWVLSVAPNVEVKNGPVGKFVRSWKFQTNKAASLSSELLTDREQRRRFNQFPIYDFRTEDEIAMGNAGKQSYFWSVSMFQDSSWWWIWVSPSGNRIIHATRLPSG